MFKWLINLFLSTPYGGSSCACCEGKKEALRKMQRAIEKGDVVDDELNPQIDDLCSSDGCRSQEYHAKILGDLSSGSSLQEISKEVHRFKQED